MLTRPGDIKRLLGKSLFHTIAQLKLDTSILSDPQVITQLLVTHFTSASVNSKLQYFLTFTHQAESLHNSIDTSDSSLLYDHSFSLSKLGSANHKNLSQTLITIMPPYWRTFTYTLFLISSLYSTQFHTKPSSLEASHHLPKLKATKDPSFYSSYQRIALTCTLDKLFQKILDRTLFWFSNRTTFSPLFNKAEIHASFLSKICINPCTNKFLFCKIPSRP